MKETSDILQYFVFVLLTLDLLSLDSIGQQFVSLPDITKSGYNSEDPFKILRSVSKGRDSTSKFNILQCHDKLKQYGICQNKADCYKSGGKLQGSCAAGFGVCCVYAVSCGGQVKQNMTYLSNPGFPNLIYQPMNCSFTVKKIKDQVSQIKMKFHHFNIGQPNQNSGECDRDTMTIKRQNSTVLKLCGWNSGQTVFVDIDEEPIFITFVLSGNITARMWDISVTQLELEESAPSGCLQYHKNPSGVIKTFNYQPINGRVIANHKYSICIRQHPKMCSISYKQCSSDSFHIGNQNRKRGNATQPSSRPASNEVVNEGSGSSDLSSNDIPSSNLVRNSNGEALIANLPSLSEKPKYGRCRDRVVIPCDDEEFIRPMVHINDNCKPEFCGNSLCDAEVPNGRDRCSVETSVLPFVVKVDIQKSDKNSTSKSPKSAKYNNGMCLIYEQKPCNRI